MSRRNGHRNPAGRHGFAGGQVFPISTKHTPLGSKAERGRIPGSKTSIPTALRSVPKTDREVVKLHVLDANVIMGAWDAIYKFEEHDVCIPGQVWKELDKYKKGRTDVAANARTAIRHIDALIVGVSPEQLKAGIPITPPEHLANGKPHDGKLVLDFTRPSIDPSWNFDLDLNEPDDRIIAICLQQQKAGREVVLVSNDGNCRVKARMCGIVAEPYLNEAVDLVGEEDNFTGFHVMPKDFWEKAVRGDVESKKERHVTRYSFTSPTLKKVNCNEFLVFEDGLKLMVVEKPGPHRVIAETIRDFSKGSVHGVIPRNDEQEFALQLLTDPRVHAVSLAGKAGSGKTFLALAAAISQTWDEKRYSSIIITRPTIGADEEIGFLPGTEKEKMGSWMGAVYDNLEMLYSSSKGKGERPEKGERESGLDLLMSKIDIRSLNFMKGRNINYSFIIVDETQDLSKKKLKMMSTRLGEGSKIVFLGNVAQIDDAYLTEYTCGMSIFIRTFIDSDLTGHITLQRGERHPFATLAEERL